jgi:hypothetical protein
MLEALTNGELRSVLDHSERYHGRDRSGDFASREAVYVEDLENPHKRALFASIKELSALARGELIAVLWVGTGVYQADEWRAACRYARKTLRDADLVYMIENGPLHEHLMRGLERLGISSDALGPDGR